MGGRSLDGQARGSENGDRRNDEGDEGATERRGEHFNEGSEGGGRGDPLRLSEPGLNSLPIHVHMGETLGQAGKEHARDQLDGHQTDAEGLSQSQRARNSDLAVQRRPRPAANKVLSLILNTAKAMDRSRPCGSD